MRDFMRSAALLALLVLLTGCRPKPPPPPPTVADLHFPVVADFGNAGLRESANADELSTMRFSYLYGYKGAPPLIDSTFAIYTFERISSGHGSLWHMVNPNSSFKATFDLARAPKSGIEAAREIFRARLDEQTGRRDLEEKRLALAAEKTLTGMLSIVKSRDAYERVPSDTE
jgi:hypothetical protein